MTLAERIRTARIERQMSQEALAQRAGMSLRAFRSLERGEAIDPHISTLNKLAEALDVSVTELLEEPVPLDEAPASSFDTPEKAMARKAIGAAMAEAGKPIYHFTLSQEELLALYDDTETFEEAKALGEAVRSERELIRDTLPNATFPGHPTRAVMGTLATAAYGIRRVAAREAARIRAEAEEDAKSLQKVA